LLAILHPLIGALALGAAALLLGLAILNEFVTKSALKGISEAQMRLISSAGMAIRHSDTIQAMGMQGALANRYLGENDRIQAAQIVAADRGAWIGAMSKFVRISVQVAVMALGAWLVLDNKLTSGGMIAASIVLGRALAPVEQAIGAWRSFIAARESYGRIKQLLAVVSAEEDAMRLSAPTGRLGVEQLTYAPPNSMKPIVKGMSLDLEPGSVLSVIGPSAAGKSTLCRLLVGSLKPSAGHVRLDGADLYRWDRSDIGRHVGYLPQSVELFAGTVKENIARLGDVDDAAVERAAKLAGCDQMILHLPQGYETNVGDAGVYLSGGQRQRIALARAMYKEPKLIVLDEPDSNLDDVGVDGLVRAVDTLRRAGSTIVLVTHRPPLMRTSTRTAVVANGKLEIFGPTAEVLQELRRRQEDLQKARSAPPGQPMQPKTTGIGGGPR
jgi:PrtD family type I secretion system ABC transporter